MEVHVLAGNELYVYVLAYGAIWWAHLGTCVFVCMYMCVFVEQESSVCWMSCKTGDGVRHFMDTLTRHLEQL